MPKTALQNALIREKRKNAIMETALKQFALKGIDNISIDDIAQAMHISHGLFYHYFTDKTDLINAIIEKGKETIGKNVSELINNNVGGKDFVEELTKFYLSNIQASDSKAYYIYLLLSLNLQKTTSIEDNWNISYYSYFVKSIEIEQGKGVFTNLPASELITVYFSALEGLAYSRIKYKKTFALPSVEALLNIFYKKGLALNE